MKIIYVITIPKDDMILGVFSDLQECLEYLKSDLEGQDMRYVWVTLCPDGQKHDEQRDVNAELFLRSGGRPRW